MRNHRQTWLKLLFFIGLNLFRFGVGCLPLSRMSHGNPCLFLMLLSLGLSLFSTDWASSGADTLSFTLLV